ncbi:MAG: anti-sigma factor [Myxococcota bacterium]
MHAQLSHREAKSLFLAALDDELAEKDEARFRQHLDGCHDCRSGYDRYALVVKRVQKVEKEKAPPTLASMVMRRVRRKRLFGHRGIHLAHVHYRIPVEAIIPLLIGALVAALIVLMAP